MVVPILKVCDLVRRFGCRLQPSSGSDPELLPRELDVGGAARQVSLVSSLRCTRFLLT